MMIAASGNVPGQFDFRDLLNGEQCTSAMLRDGLVDARRRTRALTDDLEGARELGPRLRIVNPPLWELAHIAWFQEHWCLRFRNGSQPRESMIANADALYNSAIAAHATRWELPLLPWRAMRRYQDDVLEQVIERIECGPLDEQLCYFVLLSVFHEDMHDEAFCFTRQTLGYPRPPLSAMTVPSQPAPRTGDRAHDGGTLQMGARPGSGFVFDNECWCHDVTVAPFAMAVTPVLHAQYEAFVGDAGYERAELWSDAGWSWRRTCDARHPVYWQRRDEQWWVREFDQWTPLAQKASTPMLHVNAHEAQAWCRWAGRRLPSEAEWVMAAEGARHDGTFKPAGWEWTTDAFTPFPGFAPGPYAEYSAPWFGDHRVLRGYSDQTHPRMRRRGYRNFFTPDRRDVRTAFRTCALSR